VRWRTIDAQAQRQNQWFTIPLPLSESSTMTPLNIPHRSAGVLALSLALGLAGCANMSAEQRGTAQGAGIGAAAGAVLSSITGGSAGTGAAIGGALGAIGGNLWSKKMVEKQQAMERATAGTGIEVSRTADNQLKVQVPSDISFAVGRADLQATLRPVLNQFAQGLDNTTVVRIVGHTDSTGSDAINDPLSLDRARTVRDYLQDRGVPSGRLEIIGRGAREPVADNGSDAGRARNRRVEIFLREPEARG
jgi:outer membrane protein OmpA-like peptidoglycan-associated protein